jgi:hypothetical protein
MNKPRRRGYSPKRRQRQRARKYASWYGKWRQIRAGKGNGRQAFELQAAKPGKYSVDEWREAGRSRPRHLRRQL